MKSISKKSGFTLLELAVTVVIIAVLAMVALPMYKHAVLKSRFSTVMPMAKALADAQEVYYLGNGYYVQEDEKDKLDITPVTVGNTSATLSETDGYDYVMTQNTKVPGVHYVVYQKHSLNYPGEIHCEAENKNDDAQWLCSSLSQQPSIDQTITNGYTTYLLSGSGEGLPMGLSCGIAKKLGFTCEMTTNSDGKQEKKICTDAGFQKVCRTSTYEEDDSYTVVNCEANSVGVCTAELRSVTYDKDGNKLSERKCRTVSNGKCSVYETSDNYDYTYENGKLKTKRECTLVKSDGTCQTYENGRIEYEYDGNNMTRERSCRTVAANDTCSTYSSNYGNYDYIYDENNNRIGAMMCKGALKENGECSSYSYVGSLKYTYDGDKPISKQMCITSPSGSNTVCTASNYGVTYWTYEGNMISTRVCDGASNGIGDCTTAMTTSYEYIYDPTSGQVLSQRYCSSVNPGDGSCNLYGGNSNTYDYVYDENGKAIAFNFCTGSRKDVSTGVCKSYNGTRTLGDEIPIDPYY